MKENLKYLISEDCCDTQMDYVDEIEIAIQALEKQVAKKPINDYVEDETHSGNRFKKQIYPTRSY